LKVAVLEAGRIASGVTGYTTAKVTALHGLVYGDIEARHGAARAKAYAEANSAGLAYIIAAQQEEDIDCDLVRLDAYTFAESEPGSNEIGREVQACRNAGLPVERVTQTPLPFPVTTAARLPDQAAFHPRTYCLGLAEAINKNNGRIFEYTRVVEVEEKKTVCHVTTEKQTLSTPHVVVATHLPFMADGHFFARTAPSRSYAIAARVKHPTPDGMFISAEQPVRSVRPYSSGRKHWVIITGEDHKVGQEPDTQRHYLELQRWAVDRIEGIQSIDYRWSAQDYTSVDGMPFAGRLSRDHERVFIATAFRKWGMTNGTASARIIADAILGRVNPWAEAYDSTRTRPLVAAKDYVKENLNVARHLIGDKLVAGVYSLEEIAPGRGEIAYIDGETLAIYHDEDGTFHALAPDCTHMGCRVAWNDAERSWDCPCHGSRFAPDGRVIHGPANKGLERKEIYARTRSAT
jgi:glycine/D-amino acid oxidase-like deaminating enzyme/nitrite reductase/ring-hydroxylating ferredoxin subunit